MLFKWLRQDNKSYQKDYLELQLFMHMGGLTKNGFYAGFPGPAIVATKDRPIKVTFRNRI